MFAAAAVLALGLVAAVPSPSRASWLSEFLHQRYDPGYYDYYAPPVYDGGTYYYAPPAYGYYAPTYVSPPVYYSEPYYVTGPSYYWWSGPRYYGHYHRHWGGWHEGRWHHHR
jgi:hypothetical protein